MARPKQGDKVQFSISMEKEVKAQIEVQIAQLDESMRARATVAVYTPAQIKRLLGERDRWRDLAKRKPDQFRVMLLDLFASVALDAQRRMTFTPHPALKPYFRGVL